jgi:hypothetical protein
MMILHPNLTVGFLLTFLGYPPKKLVERVPLFLIQFALQFAPLLKETDVHTITSALTIPSDITNPSPAPI